MQDTPATPFSCFAEEEEEEEEDEDEEAEHAAVDVY